MERNKELNDLNESFNKCKIENNNLSQQIQRIISDNQKLENDKILFEKNSEFFKLKTRSHEMELNDLTENYKNVIKEKERLKQNLQLFIDENKAAAQHIKKIENKLENYQKNAQNIMQDKDYLVEELNKSNKINQDLNDQLIRLKAQLSAMHIQQKSINDKKK